MVLAAALGFSLSILSGQDGGTLKVGLDARVVSGIDALVRVEKLDSVGQPDRSLWDAEAVLSMDSPGIALSTNRIRLRNGLGSGLVRFTGTGDCNLLVALGSLQTNRAVTVLTNPPVTTVGGTLPGNSTIWTGIIVITNDLTVPTNHTLTLLSNTLILVNGVESGTAGPDILVNGTILSLGTEQYPNTITCADPSLRWGQIRHASGQLSTAPLSVYRHTSITRAGRAPAGSGHTGQAPVIRPTNARILFEHCNLTDYAEQSGSSSGFGTPGKIMEASASELTLVDCHLARARMGPEISGTSLFCTNTYLTDMRGPDDADGVYPHGQGANQQIVFSRCVFADGDDDGIDTLGSRITVEDCIVRDWHNLLEDAKGISVFNGAVEVRRSLIVNCTVGISTKAYADTPARVTINHCTLTANLTNVLAQWKANAPGPIIDYRITNSVLWGGDAVSSDFAPTNFTIGYSDISEPWPGVGNMNNDPLFVNASTYDCRLQPYSPCIDAGDPASPRDPDGSPADLGWIPFVPPRPVLSAPQMTTGSPFQFSLNAYTNRNYRVDYSADSVTWAPLTTLFQTNEVMRITDPSATNAHRIYRAWLGP